MIYPRQEDKPGAVGAEDEPEVYAVAIGGHRPTFDRRTFIELTAAGSIAVAAAGCSGDDEGEVPTDESTTATNSATSPTSSTPTTIPARGTPSAPTGLKAAVAPTPGVRSGQVKLTWKRPGSNGGARITDYIIQRSVKGRRWSRVRDGVSTERTVVVSGLANGTTYRFRVAAENAVGVGPWSTTIRATPTTTVPSTTTVPPERGTVPPGEEGVEVEIDGETYTLPCGSPIPAGAVCTCNCVDVPSCACVGDTGCSCVGDTGCGVVSHYWYPN